MRPEDRRVDIFKPRAVPRAARFVVRRDFLAISFPFPRPVGRVFTYNEFVTVATRADA